MRLKLKAASLILSKSGNLIADQMRAHVFLALPMILKHDYHIDTRY